MELLVIAALLFFFGIGVVFEVIGFVFHLFFSGFGLIIGLILAAVTALAAVPLGNRNHRDCRSQGIPPHRSCYFTPALHPEVPA